MDSVRVAADISIRRACGFAGLGIGTVMLAFSYSLPLALRAGAALTAAVCLSLVLSAWRAKRRDVRRTEVWTLLPSTAGAFIRSLPPREAQALLSRVLRQRLLWHAERAGWLAVTLWGLTLLAYAFQPARG
jgi:hypothetical protein